jgi:hypothetical protein
MEPTNLSGDAEDRKTMLQLVHDIGARQDDNWRAFLCVVVQ